MRTEMLEQLEVMANRYSRRLLHARFNNCTVISHIEYIDTPTIITLMSGDESPTFIWLGRFKYGKMDIAVGIEAQKDFTLTKLNALSKEMGQYIQEKANERLTLDSAINHIKDDLLTKTDWSCPKCKDDHEVLLEFLVELKEYREGKRLGGRCESQ